MEEVKMVAAMSLPGRGVSRGEEFEVTEQEARDLEQFGRAKRVSPAGPATAFASKRDKE